MSSNFSTFVMSETTINQIKVLPEETQLKFFWAVTNYGIDSIEPDFTGLELAIWIPMRDLILNAKKKNEEWHEKQREYGKKGAGKRWQPHVENGNPIPEMASPSENGHNDNDNDNDNDNGNENVNEKENDNTPQSGEDCFSFSESKKDTPEPDPLPDKPSKSKEDATTVFNKARTLWNGLGLTQCRDLIMPGTRRDECLRTLQNYSWLEIENAINNFQFHVEGKFKSGEKWARPPPYGSLYGFLETGVARYFDDKAFEQQFREV